MTVNSSIIILFYSPINSSTVIYGPVNCLLKFVHKYLMLHLGKIMNIWNKILTLMHVKSSSVKYLKNKTYNFLMARKSTFQRFFYEYICEDENKYHLI